jgi:hypothetical protein
LTLSTKLKITAVMTAVLMAVLWTVPVGGGNDAPQKLADGRYDEPLH